MRPNGHMKRLVDTVVYAFLAAIVLSIFSLLTGKTNGLFAHACRYSLAISFKVASTYMYLFLKPVELLFGLVLPVAGVGTTLMSVLRTIPLVLYAEGSFLAKGGSICLVCFLRPVS